MYLFFTKEISEEEGSARITGSDVNHIRNVLRMKAGDKVRVSDGASCSYTAEIAGFGEDGGDVNLRLLALIPSFSPFYGNCIWHQVLTQHFFRQIC